MHILQNIALNKKLENGLAVNGLLKATLHYLNTFLRKHNCNSDKQHSIEVQLKLFVIVDTTIL